MDALSDGTSATDVRPPASAAMSAETISFTISILIGSALYGRASSRTIVASLKGVVDPENRRAAANGHPKDTFLSVLRSGQRSGVIWSTEFREGEIFSCLPRIG